MNITEGNHENEPVVSSIPPVQARDTLAPTRQNWIPYPPSWINRLTDWITRLPGPSILFYLGLWVMIYAIETGISWSEGAYPVRSFSLFQALFIASLVYFLMLIKYLNRSAASALAAFRPATNLSDEDYARARYEFTTLPAGPTLIASLLVSLIGSGFLLTSHNTSLGIPLFASGASVSFEFLLIIVSCSIWGAFVYQLLHQVRMVDRLYRQTTHINLFQLHPIYAFSGLTARMAIGCILPEYVLVLDQLFSSNRFDLNPFINFQIGETIDFTVIALVIFVWPLLGIHRMIVKEKHRAEAEAAQHLEAAITQLYSTLDAGKLDTMPAQNNALSALTTTQSTLAKIPTWPWQPDTIRWLMGALLLPTVLWIVTRLLEHLGL